MPKPATYKREYAKQAEKLCKQGATDFELGIAFGVSRRTIGYWASKYKEFGTALKVGKDIADDRVERTLYERATGYSYDAVKILQNNGKPVVPFMWHKDPRTVTVDLPDADIAGQCAFLKANADGVAWWSKWSEVYDPASTWAVTASKCAQ